MNDSNVYCMEKDGAVNIPDEYKKMSYEEISAECARLEKKVKEKTSTKKHKIVTKTKFAI